MPAAPAPVATVWSPVLALAREFGELLALLWVTIRWLVVPRFEKTVDARIASAIAAATKPINEQLTRHDAVFQRFPDTMERLDETIGKLATALDKLSDKVEGQGHTQARMSGQLDTLLDRRSGRDRRAESMAEEPAE